MSGPYDPTPQEALMDTIYDAFAAAGLDTCDAKTEKLGEAMFKICGDVYGDAYQNGRADEALAQEFAGRKES